jgi:Xaa-Pro aminopeptidase
MTTGKPASHSGLEASGLVELKAGIGVEGIDALLITHLPHIRFLTGFTGSHAQMLVGKRSCVFQTDDRYREQAAGEVQNCRIIVSTGSSMTADLEKHGCLKRIRTLGFEEQYLTVGQHRNLKKICGGIRLRATAGIVESITARKRPHAIGMIRRAVRITDAVFESILPHVRPGASERDIATEISHRHRMEGADGDSFEPIVLSGPRTSLVHGRASTRKIKSGDLVLLDFGCRFHGYCSDMTRTVAVGRASAEARRVHGIVLDAQLRALDSLAPGAALSTIDDAARGFIREAGYGDRFTHGLGHGVGLEVHESPALWWQSKGALEEGNVLTIEPGIYIPGRLGVRIEDVAVITRGGAEILTSSPKELLILQ